MSVIDEFTDPVTGDYVKRVDGVEVSRVAQPTQANAITIRTNLAAQVASNSPARHAMTTNTTYLGVTSPTYAQVAAQVKALTNQNQVIIPNLLRLARLALTRLDADA